MLMLLFPLFTDVITDFHNVQEEAVQVFIWSWIIYPTHKEWGEKVVIAYSPYLTWELNIKNDRIFSHIKRIENQVGVMIF